jgi:hypothetical protein
MDDTDDANQITGPDGVYGEASLESLRENIGDGKKSNAKQLTPGAMDTVKDPNQISKRSGGVYAEEHKEGKNPYTKTGFGSTYEEGEGDDGVDEGEEDYNELSADHQQVTIQGQATFRISEPKRAAQLFNFSVDPLTQAPLSDDREKVGRRVANLVQVATRGEIGTRPLEKALGDAPVLAAAVSGALGSGGMLAEMGVESLSVEFLSVRPTPEVAKALEAELRESLLRRADIAVYARRAATIDEERSIREKELASDKALEEQRKGMIELVGANSLREAENAAAARAIFATAMGSRFVRPAITLSSRFRWIPSRSGAGRLE